METELVYWLYCVIGGLLIGWFVNPQAGRRVALLGITGVGLITAAVAMGLAGELSMSRLYGVLIFDDRLVPLLGGLEYKFVMMGYALVIGSIGLLLRQKLRTGSKPERNG